MTTVADLIEATRQRLQPNRRPQLNRLTNTVNPGDTAITFDFDTQVVDGTRVSFDIEDIHIWTGSGTSAGQVQRAMNGSTAATHPAGTVCYMNEPYSSWDIVRAFNEVLNDLPGEGVYVYRTVDLVGSSAYVGYDLTGVTDILEGHRLHYKSRGGLRRWVPINERMWEIRQDVSTVDFPSGNALMTYAPIDPGQDLQLLYRSQFAPVATVDDDIAATTGLDPSNFVLLPVGAAIKLTQGRALDRSDMHTQGDARRPSEVTTSDVRSAAGLLYQEWADGIRTAKLQQIRRWGP